MRCLDSDEWAGLAGLCGGEPQELFQRLMVLVDGLVAESPLELVGEVLLDVAAFDRGLA